MYKDSDSPIRNVLIVGGGTAGWMTAAYLCKAFGHTTKITLIESPRIKKIGVGEATLPNLQKVLFDFLEIPEQEWMTKVNGTYKMSIKFINWRKREEGGPAHHFYHPFGVLPNVDDIPLPQYWFHETRGTSVPIADACFYSPPLMDAQRSPRLLDGTSVVPTAWHFDAHLVVDFLMNWAKERGVSQILDTVKHVTLDAQGAIDSVQTHSGAVLTADLYIDCTGFRGVLIHQALKEPFIDMQDYLLCDRAVAAPIPHDDEKLGIEPYTSAIAMKAGWTWKTPLLGRFGSGYVYSSQFATEEEAVRDFCALWNVKESDININRIRFRTGRNRRSWVKNCVSIGLSSCFLEPLESTGIYFITTAIYQLAKYFPSRALEPELMDRFNRAIEYMYDDNRDFIQAHYFTSTRDDSPFWLANKHELTLSDSIKEKTELYKAGLPVNPPLPLDIYYSSFDNEFHNFWTDGNYYCIFSGMGFLPERPYPPISNKPDARQRACQLFADIKKRQRELVEELPTLYEYLQHLYKEEK